MIKKVAILGLASSYKLAPFNDNTWEIWGLNDGFSLLPRYDRWFAMHDLNVTKSHKCRFDEKADYYDWLKNANIPIYMQQKYSDIPNSVEYPLKEIINMFGSYFTNTVSYMIALAIFEGYEEIALYGVNMSNNEEYSEQRPSVEYFLGFARGILYKKGKDINLVYIPECSDLLKTSYLYGYEMMPNGIKKIIDTKIEDFKNKIEELKVQELNIKTCIDNVTGAINYFNFMRNNLLNITKDSPSILEKIQKMLDVDANSLNDTLIKYQQKRIDVEKNLEYCKGVDMISNYYKNM